MNRVRTTLALLCAFGTSVTLAAGLESTVPNMLGERPDAAGPPTVITVSVYLFDVDEIDDVSQRFSTDLIIGLDWRDSRLALPVEQRAGQLRRLPLDGIWTPRGLVINDRGLSTQLPRMAEVDDLGNVRYTQRLSGELAADLQYETFPFDAQLLPIDIISYRYSPDEVSFSLENALVGDDGSFSAEGWKFEVLPPEIGVYSVPEANIHRPRVTFFIKAERNTQFYLLTMFLPMTLIVFMSWTAFWLQPNLVPPRVGISTASVFSLIALGVSLRLTLPPVPYLTRADAFVVGCTLLVFLSLAVTVIGSRWAAAEEIQRALRLNAAARWVYAALYPLVCIIALLR